MEIFLSYASEERAAADALAVRLRTEGHTVFLDKDNLPEGEGYDARIRAAIASCDLYLFLVSPLSVQPGRYTMTELKFAREQFPNPRGHVLPVMSAATPFADIPPYLGAVTVLQPQGNLVAETVAEVDAILRRRRRVKMLRIGAGVLALAVVLGVSAWWSKDKSPPSCRLSASLAANQDDGLALDITGPAGTTALRLGNTPAAFDLGPSKQQDFNWSAKLRAKDGSALGEHTVKGCPQSSIKLDFGEGYALVIDRR